MPKKLFSAVNEVLAYITVSALQKVLQNCCRKARTSGNMRIIIKLLSEHAEATQDPNELMVMGRVALGRVILQQLFPGMKLSMMTLGHRLARLMMQTMEQWSKNARGLVSSRAADNIAQPMQHRRKEMTPAAGAGAVTCAIVSLPSAHSTESKIIVK